MKTILSKRAVSVALIGAGFLSVSITGCSLKHDSFGQARYLRSGTIIVSHQVPDRSSPYAKNTQPAASQQLAPLIGYFPTPAAYLPADNETWLEIDRATKKLVLYRGGSVLKEIQGEGVISMEPGDYYLDYKQKNAPWYAPDDYFTKRKLSVPPSDNRLRYRRGALGKYVLYPKRTFPIHCAPVWSEDVGGLRVSVAELSSIYYLLPLGAPIVVK